MRMLFVFIIITLAASVQAQTFVTNHFPAASYGGTFVRPFPVYDRITSKKWSFSKYVSLSSNYTFFKGGSATVFAAPVGLQLNRRLNNNLYAFAGVSVVPLYANVNGAFLPSDFMKVNANNPMFKPGGFGMYSKAELGLMYINDAKTFSISGSIGIEKNNYPMPYHNQINAPRPNQVVSSNK